jgi:hypothetical protein
MAFAANNETDVPARLAETVDSAFKGCSAFKGTAACLRDTRQRQTTTYAKSASCASRACRAGCRARNACAG